VKIGSAVLFALACFLGGCAEVQPPAPSANVVFGDVVVFLASDSAFGPSMRDGAIAARYYCSTKGKMAAFQSRERPPEAQSTVLAEYSMLIYRCYSPTDH